MFYFIFLTAVWLPNSQLWAIIKRTEEYLVNAGVPQGSILLYINDLLDKVICNIEIYTDYCLLQM